MEILKNIDFEKLEKMKENEKSRIEREKKFAKLFGVKVLCGETPHSFSYLYFLDNLDFACNSNEFSSKFRQIKDDQFIELSILVRDNEKILRKEEKFFFPFFFKNWNFCILKNFFSKKIIP